jgi:beta-1,4-mannosyl-glycoprotein beta-1,4-N-acetylglucosaminyltransferase
LRYISQYLSLHSAQSFPQSEHTFTGLPKDAVFAQHAEEPRFVRFKHKLVHTIMPAPVPGTPPFTYENAHRSAMTELLGANGADNATLVIMADVDELPSAETVRLLQGCEGWGTRVHLLLRNFIYSYEWELVRPSWRAAIEVWGPGAYYGHGIKKGEVVALSNSGWHCRFVDCGALAQCAVLTGCLSFCFRTIEEFSLKMIGYSHADRVGGDHSLLDPERIQNTICQGGDVFNMLPEAYSYHDMYALTHLKP